MQKIVIDSDIIIDFLRTGKGLFPTLVSLQAEGRIEMYVSSITVFELFAGSSSKKDESKILALIENLKVISFDEGLAQYAGEITRDKKLSLPLADFIIAATALRFDALVATRNKTHFKDIPTLKFFSMP